MKYNKIMLGLKSKEYAPAAKKRVVRSKVQKEKAEEADKEEAAPEAGAPKEANEE